MSFFTRTVIGLALVAGVVHVFRKDLQKLARVVQKPAETFVKEVKRELDAEAGKKAASVAAGSLAAGEGAAVDAAAAKAHAANIGAAAAEAARTEVAAAQPPPPPPPPGKPELK